MNWQTTLIVVGAVAAGLNAGAFFAFSNFVMPALDELAPADGASAMQAINRYAPSALFVGAIIGAGLVGLPVLIWGTTTETRWLLAAVIFSIASFVITIAFNVPRNNALAEAGPTTIGAVWSDYLVSWTRWNTARTLTSAASVAAYVMAMRGR